MGKRRVTDTDKLTALAREHGRCGEVIEPGLVCLLPTDHPDDLSDHGPRSRATTCAHGVAWSAGVSGCIRCLSDRRRQERRYREEAIVGYVTLFLMIVGILLVLCLWLYS